MIKNILKKLITILFYIFRIFRVKKNKILVVNFNGRSYGDSPKYIIDKLKDKNVKIIWSVSKKYNDIPSCIKQVKYQSIRWIYELVTSKVWINNCRFPSYVRKRKNQVYIQTWHGCIAIKKIEFDVLDKLNKTYIDCMVNDNLLIDYMISNSKFCTSMYRNSFKYKGDILEVGAPRNDELINNKNYLCNKARGSLKINNNEKILLYAPTFRVNYINNPYDIDFDKLKDVLEKKYNCKWNIIIKLHPNIKDSSKYIKNINKYIDGTNYSDIQELICASDLLITDYSSTMFEAMIARIPVILYTNDILEYNKDRGTYFKLEELPFNICKDNNELINNINNYDLNDIIKNYDKFEDKIGLKEDGKSCEFISNLIMDIISNKK